MQMYACLYNVQLQGLSFCKALSIFMGCKEEPYNRDRNDNSFNIEELDYQMTFNQHIPAIRHKTANREIAMS